MSASLSRQNISVGLLSAAIIAYQIALMNAFSFLQWNHFASMMISLALLGFGASGTFITLFKKWAINNEAFLIPLFMILCSLSMTLTFPLSQGDSLRFDSYLLMTGSRHFFRFVLTALLLFLPFFFGGFALGLLFTVKTESINKLYAFNMVGSGIGGMAVIVLFSLFHPFDIPTLVAILPLLAGLLYPKRVSRRFLLEAGLITFFILGITLTYSPQPTPSQFKGIRAALNLPDAQRVYEKPSPYGYLQIVQSPALRYAPGLSLRYQHPIPSRPVLFLNGDHHGPVTKIPPKNMPHLYQWSTLDLPYRIKTPETLLILNAGTGDLIAHALSHSPQQLIATENNKDILIALKTVLKEEMPYESPTVKTEITDAYTYLLTSQETFDLIQFPLLGSFGGSGGLDALQEHYSLTQEAFTVMWDHLTPDGMISLSTWMDYPPRYPLRVLTTLIHTLNMATGNEPSHHLVAIRNWNLITFVLKKSPFTFDEINRVNTFANAMDFDRVLPLYQRQHLPPFHHQLQDSTFYVAIETLLSPEKTTFEKAYPFRIYPVGENRPYFSQFLKLGRLSEIFPYLSNAMLPFLELGYILLIVTFFVVIIIALILILIPLFFHSSGKPHSRATFFYFAGLGLAYMFVEIVLIQRFVLYFGNPLYASSAVISGMLIFSGIGSYISSRLSTTRRNLIRIGMGIAFILLLCAGFLTPFLKATIHLSFGVKFVISLACLAPVCLLMGMPFPLGLRNLKDNNPDDIPWAWGINGCLSVISSVLASLLCIEMGFLGVILLAAFIYGVVGWVNV